MRGGHGGFGSVADTSFNVMQTRRAASRSTFRCSTVGNADDDNALIKALVQLLPHGWWPPAAALRDECGLWALNEELIGSQRAHGSAEVQVSAMGQPHAAEAVRSAWRPLGPLPAAVCARLPGEPLPERALQLVRAGECCVLEAARLWPSAEASWCDAEYLRRGLRGACNVLSAPAANRKFTYWFGSEERIQSGYDAAPLVSTLSMTMDEYLAVCEGRAC